MSKIAENNLEEQQESKLTLNQLFAFGKIQIIVDDLSKLSLLKSFLKKAGFVYNPIKKFAKNRYIFTTAYLWGKGRYINNSMYRNKYRNGMKVVKLSSLEVQ